MSSLDSIAFGMICIPDMLLYSSIDIVSTGSFPTSLNINSSDLLG
nr:MAG TPA: hypothetical protein [Caudoviricetes sp.]